MSVITIRPARAKTPHDFPLRRWQFLAMVSVLQVSDKIEAAIEAMPDEFQRAVAKARYLSSDTYERSDPLFDQLAPAVGLTASDIDTAWMQIATMPKDSPQ
ncbi:MAG: hypothetical protein IT552_12400 [Sphingomonadaceae bacterium]|nr:hypothetical protein [Sphingomonadaceae bacterium]